MSKSEILAEPIDINEIEQLQDKIDSNSKLINELTNKLVADYCKQLDEYVHFIQQLLNDDKNPPTAEELDYFVMKLPVYLYFCGEAQENLGIKTDVAKAVRQEKYNEVYRELQKGTISDKTSQAELAAQSETITHIIYDRAYKIVKSKIEATYELIGSLKKVISRRMSENQLTSVDDGRFTNGR